MKKKRGAGILLPISSLPSPYGIGTLGAEAYAFVDQLAEAKQSILDNTDRMAQFTELMTDIVGKAIAANNENLSRTISEDVGEQVLKEMNYLMREREELEEERFRQLDEAIRGNLKKKKTPLLKKWTKKEGMRWEICL